MKWKKIEFCSLVIKMERKIFILLLQLRSISFTKEGFERYAKKVAKLSFNLIISMSYNQTILCRPLHNFIVQKSNKYEPIGGLIKGDRTCIYFLIYKGMG